MVRLIVIPWETQKRIRRVFMVIGKVIFFGVAFIGWFFFGFCIAVLYELNKFLE